MKTIRILALALIVLCLALVFASCGGGSGGSSGGADGTYYLYENGQTKSGDWIKLDGKNWEADDDTAGRYEQKGSTLIFYADVFGEEEEVWSGTLSNGKLTIEFLGETFVYYKKGMAPTSGGSSSTDKGNTPAPTSSVTYQITYDANGGAFADGKTTLTVTEQENAPLTAPDSPARDNYTFGGWAKQKKGSDLVDFSTDKATGNITLYATWKEKSASVLSVDGATIDGNSIFLYVDQNVESVSLSSKVVCSSDSVWKLYYDKMGQVEIPTKIAAGMTGELDDGDNVFYVVVTSNDGTQVNVYDLTVHRSYQVAIRYYNGTALLKTETAYTGSTYTTGYRPEITGYTFNRWKTKTGAAAESAFTIWDEQSFYADKTAKTYTVTLDVNGGNPLSQTTKTVTYDAAYSLGKPTRTGYSFAGWTVGGTLVTDASGTALAEWTYDGNRTLRAAWTANTYQVSLYRSVDEGGSVTGAGSYTYGQTVTVSATTNNGYTWLGWYDKNGSRVSENTDYSFTMGLDTTLTAKWTYYTLTTGTNDANAGSYSGYSATKVTAGRSVTISASTRNGYTWLGWYNGDVKLTDELSYTFVMPTENVTYTAKWIACPVTLERNLAAGGSVSGVSGATVAGRNTTITATTNNGYTWLGWFDGETKLTDELSYTFVMPTESVTYTAKWTYYTLSLNQTVGGTITGISTVSFNLNGASGSIPDQTVSLSDSLTYPDVPTRSGYLFTGWYTDQACTELFDFSSDLSGDLTLYAGWYAYSGSVMEINQYGSDNLLATSNAGTSSSSPKYIYFRALTSGTYYFGYKNGSSSTTYSTYLYIYDVTAGKTLMSNTMCYSTSVHAQSLSLVAGHVYYARIYRYSMSYSTTFYTYIQGTKLPTAGGKNSLNNNTTTKINAGRSVTLSASTENGYTWLGWYQGDVKLTDNLSYTFTMPTENVTYTAKWEINTYSITYNLNGGTLEPNLNPTAYTVQSNTITITGTPTRTGYTFAGWSVSSIPKGSTGDKTVTANWTPTVYSITYNLNGGTNAASNPASYTILTAADGIALADPLKMMSAVVTNYEQLENDNYSVTIETTAYTFLGWYIESTFEHEITTIVFTDSAVQLYAKWSESVTSLTVATAKSIYIRDGDYIYFGEYPQTIKADDVAITNTLDARGYYLGSDGAYYAKVTATPYGSGYTFSTGASVTSGTVYYFKVEPIRWRILSESDGVALILCDSIIDNHVYYRNNTSSRTINGQTVYPNNYKESDIRAWLNGQFYETAFSELQRKLILTTTVDNSARSTNPSDNRPAYWNNGINQYACADTQDKIFLLSTQELTNTGYGFKYGPDDRDIARRKVTSDYSRATGAYMNTSAGDYFENGYWWQRSPHCRKSGEARGVGRDGDAGYEWGYANVSSTYGGVVPALQIRF